MKSLAYGLRFGGLSAAVVAVLMLAGCTEGPDVSGIDAYLDSHPYDSLHEDLATVTITVSPSSAELTYDGEYVTFTASGGTPPYSWDVHDVSVGSIVQDDGYNAVYQRDAAGDNIVILRDDDGNEMYITVTQPAPAE